MRGLNAYGAHTGRAGGLDTDFAQRESFSEATKMGVTQTSILTRSTVSVALFNQQQTAAPNELRDLTEVAMVGELTWQELFPS
jgi:hypothetical protein